MALNVHVTRVNANPVILETHSTAKSQSHQPFIATPKNALKSNLSLIHVPEDHNIRKFPVRIFEMPAEG